MRFYKSYLLFLFAILISCQEVKKESPDAAILDLTISEKIASAHGYSNWSNINQIKFTFNVDRDSTHFERTWIWKPRTNDVVSISGNDTLAYNRKEMDSVAFKVNGGFINDRYWLLAPFNLIWDGQNLKTDHESNVKAPISGEMMQKLTIVYGSEGGYTPGDAYDFYFGDDYLIREWVFRKGNQEEPSMTTTWENYIATNGFNLALDHKKSDGNFNLYFTGLEIK